MKRHLPLLLLLSSCATEKAKVSVDLSSVYKKDGLSVVSNTRLDISRMRYVLVGPNGVVRTDDTPTSGPGRQTAGPAGATGSSGNIAFEITTNVGGGERMRILKSEDITPDPETLSFTIDAQPGTNRMLGLLGATTRDGVEHLAYLGLTSGITLKPLVDNEVRVPLYPAGMVLARFRLNAASENRIRSTGYAGALGCDLSLKRVDPLDGENVMQQTYAPFKGFAVPEIPEGDAESIFGLGNMALPIGDYVARCVVQTTIGEIVLMNDRKVSVLHAEEVTLEEELDLPNGPGVNNPPMNIGRPPIYFSVSTSDNLVSFAKKANIASNTNSQVAVRARNLDGSLALNFTGEVIIRFKQVELIDSSPPTIVVDGQKGMAWPVRGAGKPGDPSNEYRTSLTAGAASFAIEADANFLGLIEVVAVNPTTNQVEEHNQGMALFSIGQEACVARPLDASNIVASVNGHLPFIYTEAGALKLNGGKPVDMHTLFAFLAPELSGQRLCVVESFVSNTGTNDFPALKITAPIDGNSETPFVSINQPGFGYNSLGVAQGFGFATIPLRLFTDGQLMVPNTLRASPALAAAATAAGGFSLEMSAGFTTGGTSTGALSAIRLNVSE